MLLRAATHVNGRHSPAAPVAVHSLRGSAPRSMAFLTSPLTCAMYTTATSTLYDDRSAPSAAVLPQRAQRGLSARCHTRRPGSAGSRPCCACPGQGCRRPTRPGGTRRATQPAHPAHMPSHGQPTSRRKGCARAGLPDATAPLASASGCDMVPTDRAGGARAAALVPADDAEAIAVCGGGGHRDGHLRAPVLADLHAALQLLRLELRAAHF